MVALGAQQDVPGAPSRFPVVPPVVAPSELRTVADGIGFSGPGKADVSGVRGRDVPLPTFFESEGGQPEDELTPSTVETPRERGMRLDAIDSLGQSEASAPKI